MNNCTSLAYFAFWIHHSGPSIPLAYYTMFNNLGSFCKASLWVTHVSAWLGLPSKQKHDPLAGGLALNTCFNQVVTCVNVTMNQPLRLGKKAMIMGSFGKAKRENMVLFVVNWALGEGRVGKWGIEKSSFERELRSFNIPKQDHMGYGFRRKVRCDVHFFLLYLSLSYRFMVCQMISL